MFGGEASRLARIDWSKYGAMELSGTDEPTPEQTKRAIFGLCTGLRQFMEELSQLAGENNIPLKHGAPIINTAITEPGNGVSPDERDLDTLSPLYGAYQHDSWWDDDNEKAIGGLAGASRGVWFLQPAINNPNVISNKTKIVMVGGHGAGIRFERVYSEELLKFDGTPWSFLPVGTVVMWAGALVDIPTGWAPMDGTSNAAGSGIDMRGRLPYGYSGSGAFTTIGNAVPSVFSAPISGSGGVTTTNMVDIAIVGFTATTGDHSHNLSVTRVRVSASTAASGSGSVSVVGTIQGINSGTTATSVNGSHNHDFGDLANNPNLHDHTIQNDALAAGLSVGTPTTNQPPGAVLVYIERIS